MMNAQEKETARQRGMALIAALVLILVVAIIAVSSSQNSVLQNRMAGNQYEYEIAFQAAEAGMQAMTEWVMDSATSLQPATAGGILRDNFTNFTRIDGSPIFDGGAKNVTLQYRLIDMGTGTSAASSQAGQSSESWNSPGAVAGGSTVRYYRGEMRASIANGSSVTLEAIFAR